MLKHKQYFAIIFQMYLSLIVTSDDFYSKFHQTDYKIDFQRVELIEYNKSLLNFMEIKTFKYNRTRAVVNVTLNSKVNMSTEVEIAVQFYKFLSNEYRKLRGSRFQVNACKSLDANLIGSQDTFKCGNFTSCQIIQETTYRVCNFYPTESRLPPLLPNGEYKFQIDGIYKDDIIAAAAVYIKVYRLIPIPVKH